RSVGVHNFPDHARTANLVRLTLHGFPAPRPGEPFRRGRDGLSAKTRSHCSDLPPAHRLARSAPRRRQKMTFRSRWLLLLVPFDSFGDDFLGFGHVTPAGHLGTAR